MYLESVDQDEVPWGAVLKLDRVIETQKSIYIKQLRYCRDQRGALGILSSAGQLQVFQTNKEYVEPRSVNDVRGSPELLEVEKSYDLEYPYFDPDHKSKLEDRVVSFDWLTLGTQELPARVVALRANGKFEIMSMPATTAGQLSKLIPWKPPKRRESFGSPTYYIAHIHVVEDPFGSLIKFSDPNEREIVLGPLYATETKAEIPIYGAEKFTSKNAKSLLNSAVKQALQSGANPVVNLLALTDPKLGEVPGNVAQGDEPVRKDLEKLQLEAQLDKGQDDKAVSTTLMKISSSRELHDELHYTVRGTLEESRTDMLDHVMLQRAIDGYLFNCNLNQAVVNDEWLRDVWVWIDGQYNVR